MVKDLIHESNHAQQTTKMSRTYKRQRFARSSRCSLCRSKKPLHLESKNIDQSHRIIAVVFAHPAWRAAQQFITPKHQTKHHTKHNNHRIETAPTESFITIKSRKDGQLSSTIHPTGCSRCQIKSFHDNSSAIAASKHQFVQFSSTCQALEGMSPDLS